MSVNIEKMRTEPAAAIRKFLLQVLGVDAACLAPGAALATLFLPLAGKL